MLMQRLFRGRAQAVPRPRDSFNSGFVIHFTKHTNAEGVTHDTSYNPSTTRERPAAIEALLAL